MRVTDTQAPKRPSWECISPFPKTRCLRAGVWAAAPTQRSRRDKSCLRLDLWKGTVRDRIQWAGPQPTASQQSAWSRGWTNQGDPKLHSWSRRHSGVLNEALQTAAQGRQHQARCPHTWKHSLAEDHTASTVITQQFPLVGNTGMPCSLGVNGEELRVGRKNR